MILACFLNGKSYADLCQKIASSYSPPLNRALPVNGNVDDENEADEDEDNGDNETEDDNTIFS